MPDIVKKVFGDHPTADFKFELTGTYRKWTYCVQYRETDFNFVSRLMEQEGIYYYFRHTDGHNTRGAHRLHRQARADARLREDPVHRARAGRAAGARAHQQLGLRARGPARRLRARRLRSRAAERRAARRRRRCRAATRRATTRSTTTPATTCRRPTASSTRPCASTSSAASSRPRRRSTNAKGVRGRVAVHARRLPARRSEPRAPDRGGELRPGVQRLRGDAARAPAPSYRCSFVAMSSEQQFRPPRTTPKPFVQGPQTAVVVGPAGDEIYTDKYGRVKVQFHWDRLRQEGREQLVLDPRVAAVGRQGLGRRCRRRASARR